MTRNRLLLLVAIPVFCVGAYWVGSSGVTPSGSPHQEKPGNHAINGLVVNPSDLDIGEVWEERAFETFLPIVNETHEAIEVTNFAVSCGCLTVEPRSLTIPAKGKASVRLTLDLTSRTQVDRGQGRRPLQVDVKPIFKSGWPRDPAWELKGVIKSRVTLDSLGVHFGETPVQGQPPPQRKLIATVHVPVDKLEALVNPPVATVQLQPRASFPRQFEVILTPSPTLPVGPFKFDVVLEAVTDTGERLTGVKLPVEGTMQPAIRPLPARVLLGSRPLGETVEGFVVLQAPPNTKIAVDQIEVDSPDVQVEPALIKGQTPGRAFRITQRISKEGDQSSAVRFTIHKPDQARQTFSVDVCYHGEARGVSPIEQEGKDNR